MFNDSSKTAFHDAMRDLLRDLNSAGAHPYQKHSGSRGIVLDAAVVRYMINHMVRDAFPDDVQA